MLRGSFGRLAVAGAVWAALAAGAGLSHAQRGAGAEEEAAGEGGGLSDPDDLFRGRLLREGAFLREATGTLRQLSTGAWAFVFEAGAERRLPPMVVMPCMTLAAMEQVASSRASENRFVISGQVFVYRGRNYLLPTTHAVAGDDRVTAASEGSPEGCSATPQVLPGMEEEVEEEVEVERLLRELEESTPQQRAVAPAAGEGVVAPGLLREGTLQRLRRGRIVRHDGGGLDFIPASEAEGGGRADPILTLLPCQNLAEIEGVLTRPGAAPDFRLSGRVFVYDGRNYLLPTMYIVDFDPTGNLVGG